MSETKENVGAAIAADVVNAVAGGEASASGGTGGVNVSVNAPTPSAALIAVYEGFVDVTSHIIERVANGISQ